MCEIIARMLPKPMVERGLLATGSLAADRGGQGADVPELTESQIRSVSALALSACPIATAG
jgi:hypothetical protein